MLGKRFFSVLALLFLVTLLTDASAGKEPGEPAQPGAMQKLGQSQYLHATQGSLIAYMITDPQCPACQTLKRRIEEGATPHVKWRYVIVGFMGQQSLNLGAKQVEKELSVDGELAVRENTQIAVQIGVRAVPTVYYQTPQGQVRKFIGSSKENLQALEQMARQAQE